MAAALKSSHAMSAGAGAIIPSHSRHFRRRLRNGHNASRHIRGLPKFFRMEQHRISAPIDLQSLSQWTGMLVLCFSYRPRIQHSEWKL